MSSAAIYDCFHDRENVEPYPDISGIGVLVGFLGAAYISIVFLAASYLIAFDPDEGPPQQLESAAAVPSFTPNPVDQLVLRAVRPWLYKVLRLNSMQRQDSTLKKHLRDAFRRCTAAMCDTQTLTGIGILVSGYIAMNNHLSAYHWQIIIYLAWFANLTHLSGLALLRPHLQRHPREKGFRIAMMTVIFVMLIVGMVPTGFYTFAANESYGAIIANSSTEAWCFFSPSVAQRRLDGYVSKQGYYAGPRAPAETIAFGKMLVSTLLIAFSYASRVIKLSQPVSKYLGHTLCRKFTVFLDERIILAYTRYHMLKSQRPLSHDWKLPTFCYMMCIGRICATLYLDVFLSVANEILWLVISAAWGTIQLLIARSREDVVGEEAWTFGQTLPVFLFVIPLFSFFLDIWPVQGDIRSDAQNHSYELTQEVQGYPRAEQIEMTARHHYASGGPELLSLDLSRDLDPLLVQGIRAESIQEHGPADSTQPSQMQALSPEAYLEALHHCLQQDIYSTQAKTAFRLSYIMFTTPSFAIMFLFFLTLWNDLHGDHLTAVVAAATSIHLGLFVLILAASSQLNRSMSFYLTYDVFEANKRLEAMAQDERRSSKLVYMFLAIVGVMVFHAGVAMAAIMLSANGSTLGLWIWAATVVSAIISSYVAAAIYDWTIRLRTK